MSTFKKVSNEENRLKNFRTTTVQMFQEKLFSGKTVTDNKKL